MALTTIFRRSASRASIFVGRLISSERHIHCNSSPTFLRTAVEKSHLCRNVIVPTSYVSSLRQYGASPAVNRPSSDQSLLKVIESEIDCAIESEIDCAIEAHECSQVQEAPGNFPFKIEDNPGQQTISLSGNFDDETINVEVYMPNISNDADNNEKNSDDDEDNNESPGESNMSLVVRLNKSSGPILEFGCTAYSDEISIDSLSVKDPDNVEDPLAYEGPDFSDLDENLQKAFHMYLEVRGIKPSMTNYVYEYMINKDNKEYLMWLKNLKEFVQA